MRTKRNLVGRVPSPSVLRIIQLAALGTANQPRLRNGAGGQPLAIPSFPGSIAPVESPEQA